MNPDSLASLANIDRWSCAAARLEYGHDGRSITLNDVILRHGGESLVSRNKYVALGSNEQIALQTFLNSRVLFPPDDTASTLDPGDPTKSGFPQFGHGSIKLTVLFDDPTDTE